MRTQFSPQQLRDPDMAQSENILRACVHCGFCNATCPTYLMTGNENDGPRGRIYLIREMLQGGTAPDARTVAHIDSCLSCLGCATTCPSGVDYMRLVDHARAHIETHHNRQVSERVFRAVLNFVLPHPGRFAFAVRLGRMAMPFAKLLPARLARMSGMTALIAKRDASNLSGVFAAHRTPVKRVALLNGCVQQTLAPATNAATIRLLNRLGIEVIIPETAGCCGALSHHLGRAEAGKEFARANVTSWMQEVRGQGLDAIVMTASGCGAQVKDYAHLLKDDPAYTDDATHISALTCDLSEFLAAIDLPDPAPIPRLRIAWHAPCSLQHAQKLSGKVENLLRRAGFEVLLPHEAHLCCGAAGSYTLLQPDMSERLAARKAKNLAGLHPDVIVSANVGCQAQLASATHKPVLHWVQLLDWALGGRKPAELEQHALPD